jgi:hypothetical protein
MLNGQHKDAASFLICFASPVSSQLRKKVGKKLPSSFLRKKSLLDAINVSF